jgi:hypothetical protein
LRRLAFLVRERDLLSFDELHQFRIGQPFGLGPGSRIASAGLPPEGAQLGLRDHEPAPGQWQPYVRLPTFGAGWTAIFPNGRRNDDGAGAYMNAKKPGDLKIKRGKPKSRTVRRKESKTEPWYASAALRIGITTKAVSEDDNSPGKQRRPT